MPIQITMPAIDAVPGPAVLRRWHVQPGDVVSCDQVLAEVEAEEELFDMEAPADGVIVSLEVAEGESIAPGAVLTLLDQTPAGPPGADRSPTTRPGGKRMAAQTTGRASGPRKKSIKIRRLIERKMTESWQTIPHFYVTIAVDMTDVIRFRKDLDVTINDFVLAAVARTLRQHPWFNSWWMDGEAVEQPTVNLAMAVATDRGLYYPVLHNCADLGLKEFHRQARELAARAHRGAVRSEDVTGATFTVTNMGMMGVESFGALVTPPQVAVLAVGTVRGEVVVDAEGEPGVAPMVRLTLSVDHRALDGADAAEFLDTLKCFLEAPITLVQSDE